jgi:hypothetical protein
MCLKIGAFFELSMVGGINYNQIQYKSLHHHLKIGSLTQLNRFSIDLQDIDQDTYHNHGFELMLSKYVFDLPSVMRDELICACDFSIASKFRTFPIFHYAPGMLEVEKTRRLYIKLGSKRNRIVTPVDNIMPIIDRNTGYKAFSALHPMIRGLIYDYNTNQFGTVIDLMYEFCDCIPSLVYNVVCIIIHDTRFDNVHFQKAVKHMYRMVDPPVTFLTTKYENSDFHLFFIEHKGVLRRHYVTYALSYVIAVYLVKKYSINALEKHFPIYSNDIEHTHPLMYDCTHEILHLYVKLTYKRLDEWFKQVNIPKDLTNIVMNYIF